MALNDTRDWIIAYDISDPKRLGRVYRLMLKRAMPQQRSVFRASMSTLQARKLRAELAALIDRREDDVRLYALPATPEIIRIGMGGTGLRAAVFIE
jgi:CRISPR-associated protein Cas2